ncbi:glycerophosphodiester phosphodiesterase [Usitatibacter palustris]|uniref:Glycerophosphodiester phosphodiesterase, cytoplasmic n=1 Tax=Usitatibacter palustris TaxID=2732487 RepID=A0A6M4H9K7_9PROT|nr:glycerophosphodiester phosphodiesterase [Usitatibacter palustris]QJR14727.1 Glycerophosphodiester phosphodiesterase, cytoplasmic [Usitatibacter palustris]
MKAWPYPKLIAHRGGGTLAPENTLAAVRFGQSLGYRACEIDVKLSSDGVAMLLHDATLERTTSGKGDAGTLAWADLAKLDAGAWHSPEFRGEPIARFDAFAREILAKKAMVNIEIKPSPGRDKETGAHVAAVSAALFASAPVPPLLSSFSFAALGEAQIMSPELPRGWLTDRVEPADWDRLEALEAASLHTSHKNLLRADVDRAHKLGLRVMIYTVNDIARAEELFSWGVDGMFTDNLRVFAERFPKHL